MYLFIEHLQIYIQIYKKELEPVCYTLSSNTKRIGVVKTLKELLHRMFTLKPSEERRFKVQDRVFVVFGPFLHKKKKIIDISMSGLSYVDVDNKPPNSNGLNILSNDSLYFDDKIPFIPISRSETAELSDNSDKANLCSVQFIGLTFEQKSQLKNFIRVHTMSRM